MNKILSSIIGGVLSLSLAASIGVGIALNNNSSFKQAKASTHVSTLEFTEACGGVGTADDDVSWTITSDGPENTFDHDKGICFGDGKGKVSNITLSTSGISYEMTKIVVNTCVAENADGTVAVKVGGASFGGTAQAITHQPANYTFNGSATGAIEVTIHKNSNRSLVYCKSVEVTYTSNATLEYISVSGAMEKTTYEVGSNWDATGLVATAHYSDHSFANVSHQATWTFDPATANSTSITSVVPTATYEGMSAHGNTQRVKVVEQLIKSYSLITSANDLHSGAKYLLATAPSNGSVYVMGGQGVEHRASVSMAVNNNNITVTNQTVAEITLGGSAGSWTMHTSEGFLYSDGGKKDHHLLSRATNSDSQSEWTISVNNNGEATIVGDGSNESRHLRFYSNEDNSFTCVSNDYIGSPVYLYLADDPYVTNISISGAMIKTEYLPINSWDPTGLVVTGTFSDNSTEDVTSDVTWSFSPSYPDEGVTSVIATATLGDLSVSSAAQSVTVIIAGETPYVDGSEYIMYLENGQTSYYFNGSVSNGYGATTIHSALAEPILFEANGSGQNIYFYDPNNHFAKTYITLTLNGNAPVFTVSTTAPSTPWLYNGTTLTYSINDIEYTIGGSNDRNTFGAYAVTDPHNRAVFELLSGMTAETFSDLFLEHLKCDATGETAPTYTDEYSWAELNELYLQLPEGEQELLQDAEASESGNIIEQAMARYDYVVAKYGYTDFIGRSGSNPAHRMMNIFEDGNNTFIVLSSIVLFSITIGAFLFLHKKKEA